MLSWGGCLWAVWTIGHELWRDRLPALVAAAFATAIGPLRYSGYALPDVPIVLLTTLSLLFAVTLARGRAAGGAGGGRVGYSGPLGPWER